MVNQDWTRFEQVCPLFEHGCNLVYTRLTPILGLFSRLNSISSTSYRGNIKFKSRQSKTHIFPNKTDFILWFCFFMDCAIFFIEVLCPVCQIGFSVRVNSINTPSTNHLVSHCPLNFNLLHPFSLYYENVSLFQFRQNFH